MDFTRQFSKHNNGWSTRLFRLHVHMTHPHNAYSYRDTRCRSHAMTSTWGWKAICMHVPPFDRWSPNPVCGSKSSKQLALLVFWLAPVDAYIGAASRSDVIEPRSSHECHRSLKPGHALRSRYMLLVRRTGRVVMLSSWTSFWLFYQSANCRL